MSLPYGQERDYTRYNVDEWNLAEYHWQINNPSHVRNGVAFNELSAREQEPFIEQARDYLRKGVDRHVGLTKIEKPLPVQCQMIVQTFTTLQTDLTTKRSNDYAQGLLDGLTDGKEVLAQSIHFVDEKNIGVVAVVVKK